MLKHNKLNDCVAPVHPGLHFLKTLKAFLCHFISSELPLTTLSFIRSEIVVCVLCFLIIQSASVSQWSSSGKRQRTTLQGKYEPPPLQMNYQRVSALRHADITDMLKFKPNV